MLNIIYRICEKREGSNSGGNPNHRPTWFSKKKCLLSFLKSVESARSLVGEIVFIHDGPKGELYDIVKNYNHYNSNHGNYIGTLSLAYEIALSMPGDLYFVEDDYLHIQDSVKVTALALDNLKLISGYDHPVRYNPMKYNGCNDSNYDMKVVFDETSQHHWRTNESVCHTYAISGEVFRNMRSTITNFECIRHDQNLFRELYRHNIPLWTSIPGIITQVDPYLSPGIDWEKFNLEI
jgi:hypothetical protein